MSHKEELAAYEQRVGELEAVLRGVKALLKGDYNHRTTNGLERAIEVIAKAQELPYLSFPLIPSYV